MRDDGDFLKDLRLEIAASQQRRTTFVRLKLGAIIGIFGLGSIKFDSLSAYPLLYLTPFAVLVFDLFIAGEDFAVKRAGRFLLLNPCTPKEEKRWERTVCANRDPVSTAAHLISSVVLLCAAALCIWHFESPHTTFYWVWIAFCILVLVFFSVYDHLLVRRMKKLQEYLTGKERLHADAPGN
jgi:hypothetical protein